MARIRAAARAVRPVDPEFAAVVARRWAGLPQTARAPCQVLGRHGQAARARTKTFPAATWPARPVTTPATPTGCGSTGPHTMALGRQWCLADDWAGGSAVCGALPLAKAEGKSPTAGCRREPGGARKDGGGRRSGSPRCRRACWLPAGRCSGCQRTLPAACLAGCSRWPGWLSCWPPPCSPAGSH